MKEHKPEAMDHELVERLKVALLECPENMGPGRIVAILSQFAGQIAASNMITGDWNAEAALSCIHHNSQVGIREGLGSINEVGKGSRPN